MELLTKFARRCRMAAHYALACLSISLVLGGLVPPALAGDNTPPPPSYSYFATGTQYFATGNPVPVRDLPAPRPQAVQPVVIMGGGPDVDEAYRWMIQQAGITQATGGRFVVIRASGTDAYDPYFYFSDKKNATNIPAVDGFVGGAYLGLTAAETLIITNQDGANDPFVNAVVGSANALWIAGGDQSKYVSLWKGTKLNATIAALMQKNVPVGGTSAGANVMGEFIFSALNGTVTSTQALSNPYNQYMTLDPTPLSGRSFLNVTALANTFVDPHFDSRDRMGRLVTFVSRSIAPWSGSGCEGGILRTPSAARGIGLDVETALEIQRISDRFIAQRVTNLSTKSSSAVHFLRPLTSPAVCASGKPLTIYGVHVQRLDDATAFDMTNWWNGGNAGLYQYIVDENAGVQSPGTIPY
ncbi:cyanophycinase [Cupriavidus sp. TMH.W2]|uniref:cyanophycinase n=1 Tax=Cupriavidus sp. TMH.W2 TaxID=3434465 RepID=UPI003D76BECA